nr:MAG TPA_asm: hypothetical protein [Caudoviricetes sp.]
MVPSLYRYWARWWSLGGSFKLAYIKVFVFCIRRKLLFRSLPTYVR